jgi:hypothetical protein
MFFFFLKEKKTECIIYIKPILANFLLKNQESENMNTETLELKLAGDRRAKAREEVIYASAEAIIPMSRSELEEIRREHLILVDLFSSLDYKMPNGEQIPDAHLYQKGSDPFYHLSRR